MTIIQHIKAHSEVYFLRPSKHYSNMEKDNIFQEDTFLTTEHACMKDFVRMMKYMQLLLQGAPLTEKYRMW